MNKYSFSFLMAFMLFGCTINSSPQSPYTLNNAPWSNQPFETCKPKPERNLRPVVFQPQFTTGVHTTLAQRKVDYIPFPAKKNEDGSISPPGIMEVISENLDMAIQETVQYLDKQYIGYLNTNNEWVDENRKPIFIQNNFTTIIGEVKAPTETQIYGDFLTRPSKRNLSKHDIKKLTKRLHASEPCTFFYMPDLVSITIKTKVENQVNAPFICKDEGGIVRADTSYIRIGNVDVINRVHGDMYAYIDGNGKFYPRENFKFGSDYEKKYNGKYCNWTVLKRD